MEKEVRLIDADKLKNHYAWWEGGSQEMTLDRAKQIFDTIVDLQQTVDVERHGRWKKSYISAWYSSDDTDHLYLYCSACDTGLELQGNPARKIAKNDSAFKYCPFCGAKMDEVEDAE